MTDTLSNSAKNEAIEALLAAALMNADAFGGDVLAAARAMLEDAAAAKAEREMDRSPKHGQLFHVSVPASRRAVSP